MMGLETVKGAVKWARAALENPEEFPAEHLILIIAALYNEVLKTRYWSQSGPYSVT